MILEREKLGSTMRVLRPAAGVYAFYDGRIDGLRAWSDERNWLDDGAFSLGTASYALVSGQEALVYDAQMSLAHAGRIRRFLEDLGVREFQLIVSHWHTDHVAGNAAFEDCPIVANRLTAGLMAAHRAELAAGSPAIDPLVMPTVLFDDQLELRIGDQTVELRHADIHSVDGTVLWRPSDRLLLCGDTLEDTVTYVSEPDRLPFHLKGLEQLARLPVDRILPNHGAEARIAAGGYGPDFIQATRRYTERLLKTVTDPALAALPLSDFIADDIGAGILGYFQPYEDVHTQNLQSVAEAARTS